MDNPIRRPEEILAYRRLSQILGPERKPLWTVGPADRAHAAIELMANKDIGFLVVLGILASVLGIGPSGETEALLRSIQGADC